MKLPPLYIFGAGGHAREVAAYFRAIHPTRVITYVVQQVSAPDCISVTEYHALYERSEAGETILGSGRCNVRRQMLTEVRPPFATFIHATAVVLGTVGAGCVIAPHAVVAPHACLGEHVLVNYNATIGHDALIGDGCVVGPTAAVSGFCQLAPTVYVGAGALIRENLTLAEGAVIGMGAVVVHEVLKDQIIAGVPGRPMTSPVGKRGWL